MARTRKLFPSYGGALANSLLAAVERGHVVQDFVSAYVAEHNRRGILGGPARDRELLETIGREVLLAMIQETRRLLPGFFGRRMRSHIAKQEQEVMEAFSRELLATLDRARHPRAEDRRQFRRDLAFYTEFAARRGKAAGQRRQRKIQEEESPFVGRIALLLDPSMLEQARRAARRFHGEVERLTQNLFRRTLRVRSR
jgi:hypothetical protein